MEWLILFTLLSYLGLRELLGASLCQKLHDYQEWESLSDIDNFTTEEIDIIHRNYIQRMQRNNKSIRTMSEKVDWKHEGF